MPGVGKKSAERITYHLLRLHKNEAAKLSDAIRALKENVRYCSVCYNLTEEDVCEICSSPRRDQSVLCIVEQPRDLIALEDAGVYNGLYHVLLGRISPLEQIGPEQLTIDALVQRIREGSFEEVVLATNPTVEGDGTALHIMSLLERSNVNFTRPARGITSGNLIELSNRDILHDAMTCRQSAKHLEKE